jgi:hypothetical protein
VARKKSREDDDGSVSPSEDSLHRSYELEVTFEAASSPVVYLDFGVFPGDCRTVWVGSVLFAVRPNGSGSALRSSSHLVVHRVASNAVVALPCPWAPLQSMTAVASQQVLEPRSHRRMRGAACDGLGRVVPSKRQTSRRLEHSASHPEMGSAEGSRDT